MKTKCLLMVFLIFSFIYSQQDTTASYFFKKLIELTDISSEYGDEVLKMEICPYFCENTIVNYIIIGTGTIKSELKKIEQLHIIKNLIEGEKNIELLNYAINKSYREFDDLLQVHTDGLELYLHGIDDYDVDIIGYKHLELLNEIRFYMKYK